MRFIADEGVEAPVVGRLRDLGHSVWYVAEMEPGMTDEAVLLLTGHQMAILITNDKDFGALVFQQRQATGGVLLLRLAGLTTRMKADLVAQIVAAYGNELSGAFTVLTPKRIRIRPSQ